MHNRLRTGKLARLKVRETGDTPGCVLNACVKGGPVDAVWVSIGEMAAAGRSYELPLLGYTAHILDLKVKDFQIGSQDVH
jgi:hypothetical protein